MVSESVPAVQTVGVGKTFRDFWNREKVAAVSDLNLEVRPREVFGLLGPNGSGKSTTVKMILGLLYPSRGVVRVLGKRPTDVGVKARIGFLPEESYLYPFLTARETLDFYGRLFRQSRPERKRRIDMLLDMVDLTSMSYRRVGEFSKGMQRRVGLAQALINDPDLLILDEPTSGLDPLGVRLFKDIIGQLAQRGKTVILCSHLLGDVEEICDRVAILYGGRERAVGPLDDLLAQTSLTQIVSERLSDATVEEIRGVIAARESKSVLDVSAPRDKLETLFLRIVAEARSARRAAGESLASGQVAEFLRDGADSGADVIEQLVAEAEPQGAEQARPDAEAPEPQTVDKDMLAALASAEPAGEAETAEPAGQSEPAGADEPKPDHDVIDSLLDEDGKDRHA